MNLLLPIFLACFSQDTGRSSDLTLPVLVHGRVLSEDGRAVVGAEVLSSSGGRAFTDENGGYALAETVRWDARTLTVSTRHDGLQARTRVDISTGGRATAAALVLAHGPGCTPTWLPEFGGPNGCDGDVLAFALHGGELVAGGSFRLAGGAWSPKVAAWTGAVWKELGTGLDGEVRALTSFDAGNGPQLIAGGMFVATPEGLSVRRLARYDGTAWQAIGSGLDGPAHALGVFDFGSGPALVVGGDFLEADGVLARRVATWDGSTWSPLGDGFNGLVEAFAAFDDGHGPALYAAGSFTASGSTPVAHVARWNGSSWEEVGGGAGSRIQALLVHDDGSGPALYAAGVFTTIGGIAAGRIARWNGQAWSPVGGGLQLGRATALASHDDGTGAALYVGGWFGLAAGAPANRLARWDGTAWSSVGNGVTGFDAPAALASFAGELYAGGGFEELDFTATLRVGAWDGDSWHRLGFGLDDDVASLALFDDGSGERLHREDQQWDGERWQVLGGGLDGVVGVLLTHDDGSGPAVYAGRLPSLDGNPAGLARWDGNAWSLVGAATFPSIRTLATYDDGSGAKLYASSFGLHVWDGATWTVLPGPPDMEIAAGTHSMVGFDDGSGQALYVVGRQVIQGQNFARASRWDGSTWTSLSSFLPPGLNFLAAVCVHDDGSGPALFAAGHSDNVGMVLQWQGGQWVPFGPSFLHVPYELVSFDAGDGPSLYVAGSFTQADSVLNHIARWDGSTWAPLEGGTNGRVFVLLAGPDVLYVGGQFTRAFGSRDGYIAQYGCDREPPELSCPAGVQAVEGLTTGPGAIVHFEVTASDNKDESVLVEAVPPSGSVFPRGVTTVTATAHDAAGNTATCTFPVTVFGKARPARRP